MTHASEALHWYGRDGSPQYTVKAKAGHERNTTLADARKLGLVPSVTTVIRCADRPGLTNWMLDQAILAALTLPRLQDEQEAAYLARIKRDSKEQARKAAERGTAIHAAIQSHYQGEVPLMEFWHHVHSTVTALGDWVPDDKFTGWVAEQSFASPLGYGGKVDINTSGFVADIKTKEFGPEDDLKTWDEHAMQLAAYRHGLGMPTARAAIVYVSVTTPGLAKLIEIPEAELVRGWKCFYSLLQYWKAKNSFDPSFEKELAA